MSLKTKSQLITTNTQSFVDNEEGVITPQMLRSFHKDMIDSLVDEITYDTELSGITNQISSSVSTEASIRESVDSSLSVAIQNIPLVDTGLTIQLSTEISNRISSDNVLSTNLSTEIVNRISGDSLLSTNISTGLSTEIINRTSVDNSLSIAIQNIPLVDTGLTIQLSAEISNRISGDNSISTALSTETYERLFIDSYLQTQIDDIIIQPGEPSLIVRISQEEQNRMSGDASLSTAIQNIQVDTGVTASLSQEVQDRISGDVSLSIAIQNIPVDTGITTALSTEVSNRISVDESLSTSLSTEIVDRISGDTSLSTDLSTEMSIRSSVDTSLSTNIYWVNYDANWNWNELHNELSTEKVVRGSADTSLSSALSVEIYQRQFVNNIIVGDISTETSQRISVDSSISTNISTNYVPYSGGTTDVDLGDHTIKTDGIKLDTVTPYVVLNPGEIGWNSVDGTFDMKLLNNTTLQAGQELHFYGKAVGNILNGDVVQFDGVQGDHFLIKKSVPSEIYLHPEYLMGVATDNIISGEFGYVTSFGKINNTYTYDWTLESPILYFDFSTGNTTGGLTDVEPQAPTRRIIIASVVKLQTGGSENGIIFIRPSFGCKLTDLDDVDGTPLTTTGQILVWDNERGIFDFTSNVNNYSTTGHTHTEFSSLSTDISSEIVNRGSADTSLSNSISTETSTRISVDTLLSTSISNNTNSISTETSNRISVDNSLSTSLSNERVYVDDTFLPLTAVIDTKDYTGFISGDTIDVSYDFTNRTITLTGDLTYYYRGVKKSLTSPYTSTGHTTTNGTWFLSSQDGTNFGWSQTPWKFEDIMAAYVYYTGDVNSSFGIRETHGIMDYLSHQEFHTQIGTYLVSGGKLTAGTFLQNSNLDSSTTPGFDAAVIKDEDVSTNISTWTEGTYTTMYVSGSTSIFNTGSTFPFISAGSYLQVNNITNGVMTNGVNSRWYNVYQILMPVTSDVLSQKYRMIMLQPQTTFTSLTSAISENINSLSLGSLTNISPEFVIYSRITYVTSNTDNNTGKCRIATGGVTYNIGNRTSQISISGSGSSNHSSLSNLTWLNSAHIGSINTFATFDVNGNASEILVNSIATSSDLSTEISNRISGDTSLSSDLSTEISNRISGDNILSTDLSTESSTRISVDNSLSTDLSTEIVNRGSADTSLSTSLSTELSNRISGDTSLTSRIDNLTLDNLTDVVLTDVVDRDVMVYVGGDSQWENIPMIDITSNVADGQLLMLSGITITGVTVNIGTLPAELSTEISNRISGDSSLSSSLSSEIVTRDSVDTSLSTSISNNINSISTESSVRLSVDNSLSTDLSSEIVTRGSVDNSLSTDVSTDIVNLSTETSNRISVDSSLSTGLSSEIVTRGSVDSSLSSSLSTETSTRISVDTVLSSAITSMTPITSINTQTGTTYTLVLTDSFKLVTCNNGSTITITIPTNASVAFGIGTQIDFIQYGAGKITFGGSSVTINSKGGLKSTNGQWVGVSLIKTATDTWSLVGDLIA